MFNSYLALMLFLTVTVLTSWCGKYRLSIILFILFLILYLVGLVPHFQTHYPYEY